MRSRKFLGWVAVAAMLALPVMAYAQEASLIGTISDTTGGALPGVTLQAVHQETGNSFEAVTDANGSYLLPLRVGPYEVTAELAGFGSVAQAVLLLVGQQGVMDFQMVVGGVEETVTVTGEAPLLDLTSSSVGGNIDPRQMAELPVNGRDWLNLAILAPGARMNSPAEVPVSFGSRGQRGDFQMNVDGQQVTQHYSGSAFDRQPKYSRDAMAEFEFLSSRWDATQGRTHGVVLNAITKSGTNTASGSFGSYFRHDSMIAKDFVADRVLPYQDQQYSGTIGGPIQRDRIHFFANFEYEREPQTFIYNTPFSYFNRDVLSTHTEKKAGARGDFQFTPRNRLSVRWNLFKLRLPRNQTETGGPDRTPSSSAGYDADMDNVFGTLTQVLGNRGVNEFKVGFAGFGEDATCFTSFTTDVARRNEIQGGCGGPAIQFTDFDAGMRSTWPEIQQQYSTSVRNDLTFSFGNHAVKMGGEFLYQTFPNIRCVLCNGRLDARGGDIEDVVGGIQENMFPDLFDATTWNLQALSPIARKWTQVFEVPGTRGYSTLTKRQIWGTYVQDDWTVSERLTLNLGVRYDLELGAFANSAEILPFLPGNRANDSDNIGPRVGFAYSLDDRTVLRGGYGLYFASTSNPHRNWFLSQTVFAEILNDGRADFASNPWNGPEPTDAEIQALLCSDVFEELVAGCVSRSNSGGSAFYGPGYKMPYSHQPAIGLQRQLADTMAIEIDYYYQGFRGNRNDQMINWTFDPSTGANYPFTDKSKRPFAGWGALLNSIGGTRTNLHSVTTAFTKRFSDGWQASGNYTWSHMGDAYPPPTSGSVFDSSGRAIGYGSVPFTTRRDLGGEYSLAVDDQRHRAVANGIWDMGSGFQLSGLYVFGSGKRADSSYGGDVTQAGVRTSARLRPDGTIVDRNTFVGDVYHRLDVRFQKRFSLGDRVTFDGLVELFNAFNHANFERYRTDERGNVRAGIAANSGRPRQSTRVGFLPRILQLGVRLAF